ncbi:hypothetical protein QSV34_09820 [Porticoccus sp. W117]|uniref:hypothetical protein n=1 Tax=Porticoccus sp. W117 TaxID=3054777 RepID=UPI002594434D|nr:hypothetical protein [Porticoccus sp. W117]MDM3871652.1 hypothetical protein [Porticoccus sp. W117]
MAAKALLVSLLIAILPGCQLPAASDATPALLVRGEQQSATHPLSGLISSVLNGANVTLADDAFYNSSEVIIEGPRLGRTFEKPNHFRLWWDNGDCVLEHVESKQKYTLFGLQCVEETHLSTY